MKDAKAAVIKDNSVPEYTVKASEVPADAVTSSGSGEVLRNHVVVCVLPYRLKP